MQRMAKLPPHIPLFDILPRLPVKSLLRFMCVCKQWHAFLKSPMFAKMHLDHITKNQHLNHPKLLIFSTTTPVSFRTIDCEAPHDGLTATRSLPFRAMRRRSIYIITSLNGLVCIGIQKDLYDLKFSDLILWNPSTGDYKTLSKANSHNDCYNFDPVFMRRGASMCKRRGAFGLYYSDDDYKLLCVTCHRNAYIYSLKSDSWRKVESTTNDFKRITFIPNENWTPGILLKEKLYFFKYRLGSYSIIRFDLKTEKFVEMATPSFRGQETFMLSFKALRGCIHLCMVVDDDSNMNIEFWRMDGDGDWTKVVNYNPMLPFQCIGIPLHLMRNGNWLMYWYPDRNVFKVDIEKHIKETCFVYDGIISIDAQYGEYIETFVSPLPNAIANQ